MIRTCIAVPFVLALLVGCKNEQAPSPSTAAQTAATTAPTKPLELTLYSGRSEALVAPLIEKFEKSSGVTVKVKFGDSGELTGTLIEEGERSPADVFWAQDASTLGVLTGREMLAPLPESVTGRVADTFQSPNKEWIATSGRARVLVYNTAKLKPEDLPKSAAELVDPKWKGRVGWAPENASFQSSIAAMIETEGEAATKSWLEQMMANEPKAYPKNTPAVVATGAGEVDVALVNHYYLFRVKKEKGADFPAENHFFKDGKAASLVNVSGVAILKTSKNSEAAQKFVEYLLSDEAQNYFATETYEYPVTSSAKPYANLPPLDTLNPPKVDLTKLANLEATVKLLRETKALP